MPEPKTLYLVDGTSQLFRAYFAIRGLTSADGLPTNAVYGFTTMLRKLIKDERPRHLGVAFDLGAGTFRHDEFTDYKANRPPTPDDLKVQVPYARQVCEAFHIPVLELENHEADDLIATLARQARSQGFEVVIVASDKDLLQLVGDGVRVLNPSKNELLDDEGVERTFGVPPERVLDVQGLMGDSVDNIPGVPGVGEKTAKAAVGTYGGLEQVLERATRFVAAYDARDALLGSITALDKHASLGVEHAGRVSDAAASFEQALAALLEVERDETMQGRFEETAAALRESPAADLAGRAGEPGKTVGRDLRPLKKALKALDPKSGKRIWYAMHEHAEQARMSRRLATLREDAPIAFDPEALTLGPPDVPRAQALFRALGFKSLERELAEADGSDAAPAGEREPPDREAVEPSYRTIGDLDGLRGLAAACRESGRLALWVEGDRGDPMRAGLVGVALSCADDQGAYVPLRGETPQDAALLPLDAVRQQLAPLLADGAVAKVAHDTQRSAHLLRRHGMPVAGWRLDVRVGAFLLNSERGSYAPERLAEEFLGRRPDSREDLAGKGARQLSFDDIDVGRASTWAAERAEVTRALAGTIEQRLDDAGLRELYDEIDGPLLPLLVQMEARGIRVDTELLGRMSSEMEDSLEGLRGEIHALAETEFNVDSPKQLREVLFDKLGLKPRRKTAKSKVASTDAQTLEELAGEHDIARKILEYRELAKLKGTYVDALPLLVQPETGRVHTSFNPTGAATGRLSSSDPNLQNIPVRTEAGRKIRKAFVPEPGHLFLASDYSQIELRILAHYCEDPELIRAFREGQDIHRHTAAAVGGVRPEQVTPEMRRRAKAVNFGILYGMSEIRLAREQGMSRPEARAFIQAYFDRFPAVRDYIDETRDRARREGAVRTLFGRVRYFPQLHQRVNRAVQEQALRAAVNTPLQGTAADLMKLAMLRVQAALEKAGLGTQILLQVHDELLLEVPEAEVEQVGRLVEQAMEGVRRLAVPLTVDQKVGRSWEEVT